MPCAKLSMPSPSMARVVIGEGERDEAPMLYIGEKVGSGGPKVDIALDPLEGTTICATGGPNALAVIAMAEAATFSIAQTPIWTRSPSARPEKASSISTKPRQKISTRLAEAKKLQGRRSNRDYSLSPAP